MHKCYALVEQIESLLDSFGRYSSDMKTIAPWIKFKDRHS